MATLSQIFSKLTDEVVSASSEVFFSEGGDAVSIYKTSDLIAYLDSGDGSKIALEFVLFDEELYLTSDGSISLLPKGSEEPLILEDREVLKTVGQYLGWRLKALVTIGV